MPTNAIPAEALRELMEELATEAAVSSSIVRTQTLRSVVAKLRTILSSSPASPEELLPPRIEWNLSLAGDGRGVRPASPEAAGTETPEKELCRCGHALAAHGITECLAGDCTCARFVPTSTEAAPGAGTVPDLHQQIMNMPCDTPDEYREVSDDGELAHAYALGFRDARHAAAELAVAPPPAARDAGPELLRIAAAEHARLRTELAARDAELRALTHQTIKARIARFRERAESAARLAIDHPSPSAGEAHRYANSVLIDCAAELQTDLDRLLAQPAGKAEGRP